MTNRIWMVYILECADRSLYTGITIDLERRLRQHELGKASKYTRSRRPVRLIFSEPADDRGAALRREAAIKRLPSATKRALVKQGNK